MKCPKCGEPINLERNFCSCCSLDLRDKRKLFEMHKKKVKKQFIEDCKEESGEKHGFSKLGEAAFCIACGDPEHYDFIHGDMIGTPQSYIALKDAVTKAEKVFQFLLWFQNEYNQKHDLCVISGDKLHNVFGFSKKVSDIDFSKM